MVPGPRLVIPASIFGSLLLAVLLLSVSLGTSGETSVEDNDKRSRNLVEQMKSFDKRIISGNSFSTINLERGCKVSDQYPASILQWCEWISHYSVKRGLNPDLVAALIWQESNGNPVAYSSSGAVGLMQVMPRDGIAASFICINGPCFSSRPPMQKLKDPEFNISYGTKMLARLINKHKDPREALKAYGPINVGYYYADKVLGIYEIYKSN